MRSGTGDDRRGIGPDKSAREIGKLLGRHPSTIAREIERNGGVENYNAVAAQERYDLCKARPKERKLVTSVRLHDAVHEGLEQKWSPEQISARLVEEYPDEPEMKVSHETIYQALYLQAKASCVLSSRWRYGRVGHGGSLARGRL